MYLLVVTEAITTILNVSNEQRKSLAQVFVVDDLVQFLIPCGGIKHCGQRHNLRTDVGGESSVHALIINSLLSDFLELRPGTERKVGDVFELSNNPLNPRLDMPPEYDGDSIGRMVSYKAREGALT